MRSQGRLSAATTRDTAKGRGSTATARSGTAPKASPSPELAKTDPSQRRSNDGPSRRPLAPRSSLTTTGSRSLKYLTCERRRWLRMDPVLRARPGRVCRTHSGPSTVVLDPVALCEDPARVWAKHPTGNAPGRDDGGCLLIEGIRKPLKATARRADDAPSSTPYQCGTRQMPGYGSRVAAHTATLQPQEVPKSAITPLLPHVGYRWGMRGLAPWQPVPSIPRDEVSPNLQLECNRKLAISCAFVGKSRQRQFIGAWLETGLVA